MKRRILQILSLSVIGVSAYCLTGCAPSNLAEVAKAMAGDNASIDATLTTPWGTQTFHRSMPNYNTNNPNSQGVTTVTLPVTVNALVSTNK